jgi:predicted O-methyltransferase YrrM
VILITYLASSLPGGLSLGIPLASAVLILAVLQLEIHRRSSDTDDEVKQIYPQLEALLHVYSTLQLHQPLAPMRGWAISPDFARILISEVLRIRPANIMEFGSGVSTILAAACLKQIGQGKLWSIEQTEDEAQKSRGAVRLHGLDDHVEVTVAPLRLVDLSGKEWMWYDISKFPQTPKLDLLVIDGPAYPPQAGMSTRYATLHLLKDRLADHVTVVLDDAASEEARKSVARWLKEFPEFRAEWYATEKGSLVLRR